MSGELWALDDNKLMVKNFNYDGTGPDAFFWVPFASSLTTKLNLSMITIIITITIIIIIDLDQVGTEGTPKNPLDESKTAILAHPFEVHTHKDDAMTVRGGRG